MGNVGVCLSALFVILMALFIGAAKRIGAWSDGGACFVLSVLLILGLLLAGSLLLW